MDKTVKNVLAAVGAVAVVKAAPVLTLGAAIGVVASNPEKVREAAEDLVGRVEAQLAKHGVEVYTEEECECCNGGPCTCDGECACDSDVEPDEVAEEVEAPAENAEPTSWEEDVPVEEEEAPVEEPEAEPAPAVEDKLEDLHAKAKDFLEAVKALAETAVNEVKK